MSNLKQRLIALGAQTIRESNNLFYRSIIPNAEDQIVTVLSRYVLDDGIPELYVGEGEGCKSRAGDIINNISSIAANDQIVSLADLAEVHLIVSNIRAVRQDYGTESAYQEAQSLVVALNRYRNHRYDNSITV